MKFSIRRKFIFLTLSLVILGFLIGLSMCSAFATRYYLAVKQKEMDQAYNTISELFTQSTGLGSYYFDYDNNYHKLSDMCEEGGFSMLIINSAGNSLFSYGNSDVLMKRLFALVFTPNGTKEDTSVLSKNKNYSIQTVKGSDGTVEYLEMYGFLSDQYPFIYRCSYSAIQNSINLTLRFYFIICLIIYFFFAIIAVIVMNSISMAIKGLALETKKVAEGDFDANFVQKHERHDELGAVGKNISEISHKLEKTISELKTSNLKLTNELKAKEKLEEQRKKYMSDVSHELKTPIALIAGYAEGLKEGISESKEDRDYYCDVIIDEANKMNTIIKRLSTLNQLEQGKSAVTLERFNVVEVIDGFLNNMSIIIEENGAEVYFNNKDVAYVWCDEFLFEEVLVNYFNNALHHLDDKKIVRINVEKIDNSIRMTVFNSGQPIPEEEIDKIWGKFYKVDKARTREYGGSGLGLSIVKAIADCLGTKCGAYNLPDGVAFYLDMECDTKSRSITDNEVAASEPEHSSRLKLSELPIWKGIRKNTDKNKND